MTASGVPIRSRRRLAAGALVVALLLGGSVIGGCTAGRSDLGTGSSVCYKGLPTAVSAVHGAGRLKGVRLVPLSTLRRFTTDLYHAARRAPGPRLTHVCLVAFSGHFTATTVEKHVGRQRGTLAVVELGYPDNRLLATLVVARQPLPFSHSSIGLF